MPEWRIGCSGFAYKEWKEVFYPVNIPQTKYFEFYCTRFNCLEINSTFYRFPRVSTLLKWYDRSPEDFKFAVKVPQTITHYRRFNDSKDSLNGFYDSLQQGLKEKLGPVLFQLPPSLKYSEEMLDNILDHMDPNFKNVIEFRHPDWWSAAIQKKLADHSVTFTGVSHPKMPEEIINNHHLIYYRLHGVPVMFKSQYSKEFIEELFLKLKNVKGDNELYVFFNNTWGIAGVLNALELKQLADK